MKLDEIVNSTKAYIGSFSEAAKKYSVDNIYILTGYRINYSSPLLILKSLFQKHNELINT